MNLSGQSDGLSSGTSGGGAGNNEGSNDLAPLLLEGWTAGTPAEPGVYALPGWLTLESPTANKTVQVSESALVSAIPAGVARARRVHTDMPWGLSLESRRENRLPTSTPLAPTWSSFRTATIAPTTGPDGAVSAGRVEDADTKDAAGASLGADTRIGAVSTVSAWVANVAGTGGDFASIRENAFGQGNGSRALVNVDAPATEWRRIDFTGTELDRLGQVIAYPVKHIESDVGTADFAFFNLETARYPSSAIPTTDATAAREADTLVANNAAELLVRGRLIAVLEFAPSYAAGEQAVDHDLLFIDPRNRVSLRTDGTVVMTLSGSLGKVTLTTEALSWAREQAFRIEIKNSPSGPTLHVIVSGGKDVLVTDPEDVGGIALPEPPRIHLLGDRAGSQECADLRSVAFYRQP